MRTVFHSVDRPRRPDSVIQILVCCLLWIALGLFSASAFAGDVTLSWDNALLNTDGSDIPNTGPLSLDKTTLAYTICVAGELSGTRQSAEVPSSVTMYVVEDLASGEWCFVGFHINKAGTWSNESEIVVKIVPPIAPGPPMNLTVQALTVFTIIKRDDRFVLVVVGSVPANTACDPSQSVNGHNVVPNDAVIWATETGPRPIVVVAQCG